MKVNIIRRLYDWVLHWAHTPYGTPALFFLAFAESSFFPVPPDVLLIALAVSVPTRAFKYAFVCSLGSVLGGVLGYGIGYLLWYDANGDFSAFARFFLDYIPGFTINVFNIVQGKYNENAFLAVFTAGFTPIPYKVFTIAGGVCKINFLEFIFASAVGRSLRFFLVAGIIWKFGEPITVWIDKYFNKLAILFTVLLIGGFLIIKLFLK
ncbi:MAG TPA: cytochrome B [Actinobacteria bacterium]|nr:cytochrome B [Actinomycetota bacterium]